MVDKNINNIWIVDRKRCIYCGNCSNICPVIAIILNSYLLSSSSRLLIDQLT